MTVLTFFSIHLSLLILYTNRGQDSDAHTGTTIYNCSCKNFLCAQKKRKNDVKILLLLNTRPHVFDEYYGTFWKGLFKGYQKVKIMAKRSNILQQ